MRRAIVALLAAAAVLLVASPASGGAKPPPPKLAPSSFLQIELPASNGLKAVVENSGRTIVLRVGNHRQFNEYRVPGTISGNAVRARFGGLGRIAMRFTPTRTLSVAPPFDACGGPTEGTQHGFFTADRTQLGFFAGAVHFRGERGYVRIDASRARGEVTSFVHVKCPPHSRPVQDSGRRSIVQRGPGFDQLERESESGHVAVLRATHDHHLFLAIAVGHPKDTAAAYFFSGLRERIGHMAVLRLADAKAPLSSFVFDHQAGTATVTPPPPLAGTASFQRNADGSQSWSGALAVSVLGADPVSLAGPEFKSFLAPDFQEG